jgi:hypothetical protein
MGLDNEKLKRIVYDLGITLCGGFNINILKSINPDDLNIDEINRIKTGYQPANKLRIHWGIMDDTNIVIYPLSMASDDFTIMLNHYDGVMVSKTRTEFSLSSKYTGWYIILENRVGVNI